jgi:hypothetical protein
MLKIVVLVRFGAFSLYIKYCRYNAGIFLNPVPIYFTKVSVLFHLCVMLLVGLNHI